MRKWGILLRRNFTESISKLSNGFSFSDNEHDYLFSKIEKDEAEKCDVMKTVRCEFSGRF